MARNWLLAHWRRIAMQAALCAVLLATIGLAALVTHEKRLALRVPLIDPPRGIGQLVAQWPRGWSQPAISDQTSAGEIVSVEEITPDQIAGRRLTIQRVRLPALAAPMEVLFRAGLLAERDLTGKEPGTRGDIPLAPNFEPAHTQRLDVGNWPGVMVTRAIGAANGGRRLQKQVLACSVLPGPQALIVRLEGLGPPDAADEELVRQVAETVGVREPGSADLHGLVPQPPTSMVELGGGAMVAVPGHFYVLPATDPNRTARDLMSDGSEDGHWAAVELIPCLWIPGDGEEDQVVSLLGARDRAWRGATPRKMADNLWRVDRPAVSASSFPTRAYCFTNGTDQALVAVLRGGWRDHALFDAAWAAISSNVRFPAHRDVTAMLDRGAAEAQRLAHLGLRKMLSPQPGHQTWSLWNQAENADKQFWMTFDWGPSVAALLGATADGSSNEADGPPSSPASTADPLAWHGSRLTWPTGRPVMVNVGPTDPVINDSIQQSWSGSEDLTSHYTISTDRVVATRGGEATQRTATQRLTLRDGKLYNLLVAADDAHPAPPQYVPGGWLPLVLWHLSDQPMVLRTESFLGADGAATTSGLLTLVVTRVNGSGGPNGTDLVNVTLNGTGLISRWCYGSDGSLRYVDFAGDLRAQRSDPIGGR